MVLRDLQLVKFDCVIWESVQELYIFTVFLNRYKIEQPDTLQHNGMTNSEIEMDMWK